MYYILSELFQVSFQDYSSELIYSTSLGNLRKMWEETSFRLELFQTNDKCALEEYRAFEKPISVLPYVVDFRYRCLPGE